MSPAPGERPAPLDARKKPLLMVDIDGVLSLFGLDPARLPPGTFHNIDGIPHFLSAAAAAHLLALLPSFDAVWCSGWEEKANDHLPHLLGLPGPLPYLHFARAPERGQAHWKLAAVERYAGARPLAWVDDAFNDACHDWAAARGAPTLLRATSPQLGLTAEDAHALLAWSQGVPGRASAPP
jgi:hypothetical protein